jgi:hypothetical protein
VSSKYQFSDAESVYFITSTVVDWIDVFTRDVFGIFFWTVFGFARRIKVCRYMLGY